MKKDTLFHLCPLKTYGLYARQKSRGFTLIEIIAVLVILGIMASLGGFAIVQVVNGYMFSRDNAELSQKAEMAMSRITREITEMTGFTSTASNDTLPLKNIRRDVTISLDGSTVQMESDELVDNVHNLRFRYSSLDPTENELRNDWPTTKDIDQLAFIDVLLELERSDGGTMAFTNRVTPRNTPPVTPEDGEYNLPGVGSSNGNGGGCFVATVAFGDKGHLAVILLRDLRDRRLSNWSGGEQLVKLYYSYGPRGAAQIEDRPLAMWAARMLLYPMAAMAFFLVYAPLALPFILLGSLLLAGLIITLCRRVKLWSRPSASQHGGILLGLVFAMIIIGFLGAALVPMFSASYMGQAHSDHSRKAYFLAESGYRYVAGEFLRATEDNEHYQVLEDMHETTHHLANEGSFTPTLYPFWTTVTGSSSIKTESIGLLPHEWIDSNTSGYVAVGNMEDGVHFYDVYDYSNRSRTGDNSMRFNNTNNLTSGASPATGQTVLPVGQINSTQTIEENGTLTFEGPGDLFPPRHGIFVVRDWIDVLGFSYSNRVDNNDGTYTLHGIHLADGSASWSDIVVRVLGTDDYIIHDKFLRLVSTGTYGDITSRGITYNIPIGWVDGTGTGEPMLVEYHERMNEGAKFEEGVGGHEIGDGSMQVTNTDFLDGTQAHISYFQWWNTRADLSRSWHDHEGNLNYDIQVKVRNTEPYFFSGMGFRMREDDNIEDDMEMYGVSFVRQRQTRYRGRITGWDDWGVESSLALWPQNDGIHPDLRPFVPGNTFTPVDGHLVEDTGWIWRRLYARYSEPAIVLWKRTGGTFEIIDYATIPEGSILVDGSGTGLRLEDWSTLLVRLTETGGNNGDKSNRIKVYYNDTEGNPRDTVNWPEPEDSEDTCNYPLVGGVNGDIEWNSAEEDYVVTNALTSREWDEDSSRLDFFEDEDGVRTHDEHIALVTFSSAATSTSYDDFAIQLYIKPSPGFLPPIQE